MSDNEHAALRNLREGRRDAWVFPPGELRDGHYEGLVLTTGEPSCPFCGGHGTVQWYEYEHDTGASYPMDYAECQQCFTRAMFSESEGVTTFVWTILEDDLEHFFAGQTAAYWQVHAAVLAERLAEAEARVTDMRDCKNAWRCRAKQAEARADAAVNLLRVQWRIAERQRVVIPDGLSEAYHDAVSAWVDVNGFDGDLTDTGEGA